MAFFGKGGKKDLNGKKAYISPTRGEKIIIK